MTVDINKVKKYWEAFPAGYGELVDLADDPKKFLEERDRQTNLLSPDIEEKYRMDLAKGKVTLDLGCGQGYNAQKLVTNGAKLTAVDLTSKGLELARFRFEVNHLQANFVRANAESLPFKDGTFEFVHSSGVIHHTPSIEGAVKEIHRVMVPGAIASIMIYNRHSIKYYYRINVKLRLKMLLLYLLPAGILERLLAAKPDLEKYVPNAWPSGRDVLNAGTDFGGTYNPLSRVFSRKQAAQLFSAFIVEGFACAEGVYEPFKKNRTVIDKVIAKIYSLVMSRAGWYLFVYLRKPNHDEPRHT
ncbi:MAG: class I SAM-dependent methyltransferase [Proteobacteria bacterium]|nr:class I SAM-dependent methyltransferase [Pseudomonadota bacterium]